MARSLQVKQAQEVRVFAHDALNLTPGGVLTTTTIPGTDARGVCLYIGQAMDLTVTMEGGTASISYKGVAAGSFLPILVTAVTAYTLTDTAGTKADNDILALY
tara:strand:+ start:270 stop:578 length:309 start_codon:yes stop_codon:yes gene_type:complete